MHKRGMPRLLFCVPRESRGVSVSPEKGAERRNAQESQRRKEGEEVQKERNTDAKYRNSESEVTKQAGSLGKCLHL